MKNYRDNSRNASLPDSADEPDTKKASQENATRERRDRLVDRLDIQVLLTVLLAFVSAWFYINNMICNLTGAESHNRTMSLIVVHYILTAAIVLCLYLTYKKGRLLLEKRDLYPSERQWFYLFIQNWLGAFILCLILLASSSFNCSPLWAIESGGILGLLWRRTGEAGIDDEGEENGNAPKKRMTLRRISLIVWLILLFPVFISSMTVLMKDIEVVTDKSYYTFDDDIFVSVNSKGYACKHKMVCAKTEVGDSICPDNGLIKIPASRIRNTKERTEGGKAIAVGTVSPASSLRSFFKYPIRKICHFEDEYPDPAQKDVIIQYTEKTLSIKP